MRIIGHHGVQTRLRKLITLSDFPRSFLFAGPESVGKRLVALQFAWTLLGQRDVFDFREEADISHPDIFLLAPEQVTEKGKTREKNIPVEAIREGIAFLSRYPLMGKRRIFIIDDAHRLSQGAQNALLKTLEEPNETSVLILVTHDAAALLDTVHSRLQRVNFSVVSAEDMRILGTLNQEDQFLFDFGRPGIIQMALQDAEGFAGMKVLLGRLSRLGKLSFAERLCLAEDIARESASAIRLLEWLSSTVRKEAQNDTASKIQATYSFLEALGNTQHILQSTQANTRLQLEKLFLKAL